MNNKVYTWKCKQCGKEIATLSEKQLSYLSRTHMFVHEKNNKKEVKP